MAWHSAPPTPPVPPPIVGTPLRPPVKVLRRCSGDCDQGLKNTAPAHAKAQDVHPDPPPSSVPPPPLVGCPSRTLGSHTTGSRHALVRPDVSHTIGTCLALLRSTVSHTIGNSWAIVRADASTICLGTCLAHQPSTSSASVVGAPVVRAMVLAAGCMKKVSPFQTLDATFGCLAHHRQQLRHGPRGCLDQPPHMPCAATGSCLSHHRQQLGRGARRCLDQHLLGAQNCLGTCLDLGGQLARTPSAPAGPWCMRTDV